jgi:Formamidopyrimidine-DNA glycosylase
MPELPDILLYQHSLEQRVRGQTIERIRLASPFLLRSVEPPIKEAEGRRVLGIERVGKRLVFALEDDWFLVLHLMIAGRLQVARHWREAARTNRPGGVRFPNGNARLTEAGSKRRASLHVVTGREALKDFDRGGLDVLSASPAEFAERLRRQSHTLKRALTDPTIFDGVGNAYSDEILHRARLSPFVLTGRIEEDEIGRLYQASRDTLTEWIKRLQQEAGDRWPEKVTAFREGMAVHGRYGKPCPDCGTLVQRIRYADNETNYCPTCQTEGRLLADRALSRLLKEDWPRSLEELDEHIKERHF